MSFVKNEFNTPVYLLATGDVVINGTISVNGAAGNDSVGGAGGPGGFDGGTPGSASVSPGDGFGPGGGQSGTNVNNNAAGAGSGSYADSGGAGSSSNKGSSYGSALLIPMIGGSGGGGTTGSPGRGGGGGAILIASDTQIELSGTAEILANGGRYYSSAYNGGSGGAVRLVAPRVFGSGDIRAESRRNDNLLSGNTYAGFGRIRVDTIDRTGLNTITFDPSAFSSVGSNMVVFPAPTPRLDLVEAVGTNIAVDESQAVFVDLPFNADPNRTVTVQATDFNKIVYITVVLQPVNGTRVTYDDSIDNSGGGSTSKAINVTFPVNTQTKIFVWTRPDP